MDSSEGFVSDYAAMVSEAERRIDSYHEPYYEGVIRALSPAQMDELQRLTDSCCEMLRSFVRQVREGEWQQRD